MNWNDLKSRSLRIYTTPWCSDCHRFKKLLTRQGLEFSEVDVDSNAPAREHMVAKAGEFSIPQLEIDDEWMVRGWHQELPSRWDEGLFFKELAQAIPAQD